MNKQKYSVEQIQAIVNRIEKLPATEYRDVFEIITNDAKSKCTRTDEKVYINMSTLSDSTLDKIVQRLDKIQPQVKRTALPARPRKVQVKVHPRSNYEKALLRNSKKEYDAFSYASL